MSQQALFAKQNIAFDDKEVKSVPYVPSLHPFVERMIGTICREYHDHTLIQEGC